MNTNKKMRKEMDKMKFEEGGPEEETVELSFEISKKKAHSVVGFNMGVCVTPDEKLWNDDTFFNVIFFDKKNKKAEGGYHGLIRDGWLTLPGINPTIDILSKVDSEKIYDQIIEHAKSVAKTMKLKGVLIPTVSSIHSNRSVLHDVIKGRQYKEIRMEQECKFSYSPYLYSFSDCYMVEKNRYTWETNFDGIFESQNKEELSNNNDDE